MPGKTDVGLERLDQSYLNELIRRAARGSSNAFAELFVAVCDRQSAYLEHMGVRSDTAVDDALTAIFLQVHRQLSTLSNPNLFLLWLCRMSFRYVQRASGNPMDVSQVSKLPLAEAQVFVMHDLQGLSVSETGSILNIANGTVRRLLRMGQKHLRKWADPANPISGSKRAWSMPGQHSTTDKIRRSQPDTLRMAGILERIFETAGVEPNSVPVEALSSYTTYRHERFTLQRAVLVAAVILFLLLPVCFVTPRYDVQVDPAGERGLPVYTIRVASVWPVHRVTAALRGHALPVYEADARTYTVEPTANDSMTIQVELFNRQSAEKRAQVTDVDANGPTLEASEVEEETVRLIVKDAGIGVDYDEIYAVAKSGAVIRPVSADEENGILFPYPEEDWEVYIPDHIGNTLHLALHLT